MNRLFFSLVAALGGLLPLILESALKGVALLAVAALAALVLSKTSAATRHLVWVVAVIALLVVPLLSVALPQWRILPAWTSVISAKPATPSPAPSAMAASETTERGNPHLFTNEIPAVRAEVGVVPVVVPNEVLQTVSAPLHPTGIPLAPVETEGEMVPTWRDSFGWISFIWAAGFILLFLRLLAAHLFLRVSARGCLINNDALVVKKFKAACVELGVRQRIILLFDTRRTIPVVWGVFRPRLLLPAEAMEWEGEQMRSVLLHELAHIKRRDPLVQWLTQVACALHWWNPLVWLAAWRIHVERERACDDLVLASGVRPSSYAEHLLEVATKLSPARWTSACGLAMARKSSLERRLRAVLSQGLRRGRVSAAFGGIALVMGAGVVIPVAMLRAAEGDEDAWNPPSLAHSGVGDFSTFCGHNGEAAAFVLAYRGDFNSASSGGSNEADRSWTNEVTLELKGADGGKVELSLRREHTAPGTLQLGGVDFDLEKGRLFLLDEAGGVRQVDMEVPVVRNPEAAERLAERIAELRPQEREPQKMVENAQTIRVGKPLPAMLESAAWGEPAESGLRAAWLLEPRGKSVPFGSVMEAKVLYHNTGKDPVVFDTEVWHQEDRHVAQDADGKEIKISMFNVTGITPLVTYRLAPGEYCEVAGHGIAIGSGEYEEEHSTGRIGAVIEAKVGDKVTFSSLVDTTGNGDANDPAAFWKRVIAKRVESEGALPEGAADRGNLLRRVTDDLFGDEPTGEEIGALVRDVSPEALEKLTLRLLKRGNIQAFVGKLPTGDFTFRVGEVDPEAAEKIRTATRTGRFILGEEVRLLVSREPLGYAGRAIYGYKAKVLVLDGDEGERVIHEMTLPDKAPFAFAWKRGAGEFFLLTAEEARRFELKDEDGVAVSDLELGEMEFGELHMGLVDAYNEAAVGLVGGWPLPARFVPKKGTVEGDVYWSSVIDGQGSDYNPGEVFDPEELAGLAKEVKRADRRGKKRKVRRLSWLISRAGAEKAGRFRYLLEDAVLRKEESLALALAGYDYSVNGNEAGLRVVLDSLAQERLGADAQALIPLAFIDEWDVTVAAYEKHFSKGTDGAGGLAAGFFWLQRQCLFPEASDRYQARKKGEVEKTKPAAPLRPKDPMAQIVFEKWKMLARTDGKIPGALLGHLRRAEFFYRLNQSPEKKKEIAEVKSRIDVRRDWEPAEVVALLDEIAAYPFGLVDVVERPVTFSEMRPTYSGRALPAQLEDSNWGETAKCGLRVAWRMADQLGGLRSARLLFHNTGGEAIYLRTQGWRREEYPTARPLRRGDFQGKYGMVCRSQSAMINWRLDPGQYCEAGGFGITIGAGDHREEYAGALLTALRRAEIAERINFWHSKGVGSEGLLRISQRVANEGPMPESVVDRELLIRRVMLDVFGIEPGEEEVARFVARPEVDALGSLASQIKRKMGELFFVGGLSSNQLNFEIGPPEDEE